MVDRIRDCVRAAFATGPLAGFEGRRRLRAAAGGDPLPGHIGDVTFRPTAGLLTTLFTFEPPFRRNGWPRDFAERPTPPSTDNMDLLAVMLQRIEPPLRVSRSYYHA